MFFSCQTNALDDSSRTQERTPAICLNNSTVGIPQTLNLTDNHAIRRGFSRKTSMEDHQYCQLGCPVLGVFYAKKKKEEKEYGWNLG